jgi:hypothetical protein
MSIAGVLAALAGSIILTVYFATRPEYIKITKTEKEES